MFNSIYNAGLFIIIFLTYSQGTFKIMAMKDQVITLATLTYEKAQVIKSILENEGVDCFLEHVNLIQGAYSTGVQINIREIDFEKAMMVFDEIKELDYEKIHPVINTETDIKILVPVDFSEYSDKAVDFALQWVEKLQGEIQLFNTYFSPINSNFPFGDSYVYDINIDEVGKTLKEESSKNMEALKNKLNKRIIENGIKGVRIKTHIQRGLAENEIVTYAKIYNPTLIIMGTRGSDKKAADLIGSVTAEVIEVAKRPILAIPESFSYDKIENINNIGYLSIFGEQDFVALEKLSEFIYPLGVNIHIAHITTRTEYEKNKIRMDGLEEHFRKHNLKCDLHFELIVNEDFLVGIESFIQAKNIDILSFTKYKRSLISRLLNPSVAKKMLFHSTTPLLVFNS